jgi:hypothetical protein
LISRSTAKASGTTRTAALDARPTKEIRKRGMRSVAERMSSSRPLVVLWAKPISTKIAATARMPVRNRIRSAGRCTRAASSGSWGGTGESD